jgi:hypothetical protein
MDMHMHHLFHGGMFHGGGHSDEDSDDDSEEEQCDECGCPMHECFCDEILPSLARGAGTLAEPIDLVEDSEEEEVDLVSEDEDL